MISLMHLLLPVDVYSSPRSNSTCARTPADGCDRLIARLASNPRVHVSNFFFFFQAEDGIRDLTVTGVQTCALPISLLLSPRPARSRDRVPRDTRLRARRRWDRPDSAATARA